MDDNGIHKASDEVMLHHIYYPRPLATNSYDQELWEVFKEYYLRTSRVETGVQKHSLDLGVRFIEPLVERERDQLIRKARIHSEVVE